MSYETVHHNTAVQPEISRFRRLVSVFQKAEYSVFFSLNLLNAVQNGVFTFGVMLVCYLCAYQISMDMQKISTDNEENTRSNLQVFTLLPSVKSAL